MHERTNEVEGLRRLADLLRQAVTNVTAAAPSSKKQPGPIKRKPRPVVTEARSEGPGLGMAKIP